jgi:hypothetical protein
MTIYLHEAKLGTFAVDKTILRETQTRNNDVC